MLRTAKSTKDMLEIQENIRALEDEIDVAEGRLKYIDDQETDAPNEYKILEKKKIKGIEYTCIKNTKRDINISYSKFVKDSNANNAFKVDSVIQTLVDKGFTQIKSNGINWLRMLFSTFEKLRESHEEIEEVEFDLDENSI